MLVVPDMKEPGGMVTSIPGLRRINRRAGTIRSALVKLTLNTNVRRAQYRTTSTSAWINTDRKLVCPDEIRVFGRLRSSPGLRRANRVAGRRSLGLWKSIYYTARL